MFLPEPQCWFVGISMYRRCSSLHVVSLKRPFLLETLEAEDVRQSCNLFEVRCCLENLQVQADPLVYAVLFKLAAELGCSILCRVRLKEKGVYFAVLFVASLCS